MKGLAPAQLVAHREELTEFGGYFIIHGIEKIVRMLIMPRRNHATSIIRPSFEKRGATYSRYGVSIRSVRPDESASTITLHCCTDGLHTVRFYWRKAEYMIPVALIMKALCETSDKEIYELIVQGRYRDAPLINRVEMLLRSVKSFGLHSKKQHLAYLGGKFRFILDAPADMSDVNVGQLLIKKVFLVHLSSSRDKFNMFIFMLQKLFSLAAGETAPDILTRFNTRKSCLPAKLSDQLSRKRWTICCSASRLLYKSNCAEIQTLVNLHDDNYIQKVYSTKVTADIARRVSYFLSTGNLVSKTGLDMMQTSGFTVIAEKLNFLRYISHFRCIHRGSFFAELKTTTVRKLLPEAWGKKEGSAELGNRKQKNVHN